MAYCKRYNLDNAKMNHMREKYTTIFPYHMNIFLILESIKCQMYEKRFLKNKF